MSFTRSNGAKPQLLLLGATTLLLLLRLNPVVHSIRSDMKTYIFRVTENMRSPPEQRSWYLAIISNATGIASSSSQQLEQRLLYSYTNVFPGFAALLTPSEAAAMNASKDIVAFSVSSVFQPQTTRTPHFLELTDSVENDVSGPLWAASNRGDRVIVGVIDTGAWPDHPSFSDVGLSPITGWAGICQNQSVFSCNNKIIGARYFAASYIAETGQPIDSASPLDFDGHGTHAASIAAGSLVPNASFSDLANGTASGIAPFARLSIYKACWNGACYRADVLAAFDAAIQDGVHVISVSINSDEDYSSMGTFVGAFSAVTKGISVVCSAGNNGSSSGTVVNWAPWILTVGASSLDREFPAPVTLGNGTEYVGSSLYVGKAIEGGLILAGEAAVAGGDYRNASYCVSADYLNATAVRGKVVMCEGNDESDIDKSYYVSEVEKALAVEGAGGVGTIVANPDSQGETVMSMAYDRPGANVGVRGAMAVRTYIEETAAAAATPTVRMEFNGTRLGGRAPIMAAFSSRGPNFEPSTAIPISKPDITAPGLNILAAWTRAASPSGLQGDTRNVLFKIISGTSMSCPHVSGLVALLKAAHPTWSPAAIKSALMTTATTLDNMGLPILDGATSAEADAFAYGSGHVRPNRALDPGLVYDIRQQDYLDFLCSLNTSLVPFYAGNAYTCRSSLPQLGDLNYPSFRVAFQQSAQTSAESYSVTFSRTVTNVGPAASTYTYSLSPLGPVDVSVTPSVLAFASQNQNLSYTITFTAPRLSSLPRFDGKNTYYDFVFGNLTWSDGQGDHVVRSPISFLWY